MLGTAAGTLIPRPTPEVRPPPPTLDEQEAALVAREAHYRHSWDSVTVDGYYICQDTHDLFLTWHRVFHDKPCDVCNTNEWKAYALDRMKQLLPKQD